MVPSPTHRTTSLSISIPTNSHRREIRRILIRTNDITAIRRRKIMASHVARNSSCSRLGTIKHKVMGSISREPKVPLSPALSSLTKHPTSISKIKAITTSSRLLLWSCKIWLSRDTYHRLKRLRTISIFIWTWVNWINSNNTYHSNPRKISTNSIRTML